MRSCSLVPIVFSIACTFRSAESFILQPSLQHSLPSQQQELQKRRIWYPSTSTPTSASNMYMVASNNEKNEMKKVKRSAFGKAAIGLNRKPSFNNSNSNNKNSNKEQQTQSKRERSDDSTSIHGSNKQKLQTKQYPTTTTTTTATSANKKVIKRPTQVLSTVDDNNLQKRAHNEEEIDLLLEQRDAALLALKSHLGLSLDQSLDILNTYPSLYTELDDLSSKLVYLLKDINIKPKQLKRMLVSHPRLMETVLLDSEDNIANTVDVLQTELDLSLEDIKMIQSTSLPAILSYPRSELRKRILVYKLDLEFPTTEMKKIVLKDPRVLRTDSRNVRQILHVLEEELDIRKEEVHSMVGKQILLLTYNAEGNIRPTIRYLKECEVGKCLGMVDRQGKSTMKASTKYEMDAIVKERLKTLIMGHPKILSSSVEKKLKPTVSFFIQECQLSKYEFGRIMYRRGGSLLEANVERTLKVKVAYLREQLGLVADDGHDQYDDDNDDFSYHHEEFKIEEQTTIEIPPLDSFVPESSMTLKVLQEEQDDDDDDSKDEQSQPKPQQRHQNKLTNFEKKRLLAQMLATNPDILTFSIENNLQPKFDYFTQTMGLSKEELRYVMLKRPQLLSLSLERNIIPKVEYFLEPQSSLQTCSKTLSASTDTSSNSGGGGGLGMTMDQVRLWLTQYPQSLTVTLDSKIKPRVQDVVELGLVMGENVPLNFLTQTERNWNQWKERYEEGDV